MLGSLAGQTIKPSQVIIVDDNSTDNTPSIIKKYVERIIRVEEEEIIEAMKLIWERMKIVIEPSSAVPFAALLKNKEDYKNKKIGIIVSGGNVDVGNLPF